MQFYIACAGGDGVTAGERKEEGVEVGMPLNLSWVGRSEIEDSKSHAHTLF